MAFLSFKACDGCGVDDHAALAACVGRAFGHGGGGEAGDVEGANQVDVNHALVEREGVRAVAAQCFGRGRDACAVDRGGKPAHGECGGVNRGGNAGFVCDIGLGKMCADLCCDSFAALCITVQQGDFCAERAKVTRGGFAEA